MQVVLAHVLGHINGRDSRHVSGDVFGHDLLNLDFLQEVGVLFSLPDCRRMRVFLCLGRVLTPPVSRVNSSSFCDKPRLVPRALWWSWYLHPVSCTNLRSSRDKPRFDHALCGGLGTCRVFAPSR